MKNEFNSCKYMKKKETLCNKINYAIVVIPKC